VATVTLGVSHRAYVAWSRLRLSVAWQQTNISRFRNHALPFLLPSPISLCRVFLLRRTPPPPHATRCRLRHCAAASATMHAVAAENATRTRSPLDEADAPAPPPGPGAAARAPYEAASPGRCTWPPATCCPPPTARHHPQLAAFLQRPRLAALRL
jgi:hypothetical protein